MVAAANHVSRVTDFAPATWALGHALLRYSMPQVGRVGCRGSPTRPCSNAST
jgi:hypothetical protein